jgi:hypothetical protein
MDKLTQGTPVPQVAAIHHHARSLEKTRPTRTRMGPKFATAMWDNSLRIWQFRNAAFHGGANTLVKRYKLEESNGKKHGSGIYTQNYNQYYTASNRNTLTPQIRSTTLDMIVKNVGQPWPNSFSTRLNPDSHPQTMNYYHGI